jgi:YidC/Oxa1 family membrane protein insertase
LTPPIAQGFFGIERFVPPWDVFFLPLFNGLVFLYEVLFSDFALAIIVFTVLIRTILAPLYVRQIRSSKEMQAVQPLIREVQRKHKGNRQKISQETMAIYKEHGVNPAAGCLPVLLQLPILFALYQALIRAAGTVQAFDENTLNAEQATAFASLRARFPEITEIANNEWRVPVQGACDLAEYHVLDRFVPLNCQLADPLKLQGTVDTTIDWLMNPFSGVALNLADIDRTFAVVMAGFSISLLAILAGLLQFVQVKMTTPPRNPDDPMSSTTSTMIYLFPIMTVVWGAFLPSGLVLYWIVYTAYLIGQQFVMMGWGNLFPVFGWSPGFVAGQQGGASSPPLKPRTGAPDEVQRAPARPNRRPPVPGQSPGKRRRRRRGREGRKR